MRYLLYTTEEYICRLLLWFAFVERISEINPWRTFMGHICGVCLPNQLRNLCVECACGVCGVCFFGECLRITYVNYICGINL